MGAVKKTLCQIARPLNQSLSFEGVSCLEIDRPFKDEIGNLP